LHSREYLQCALVLQHPRHAEQLGALLAEALRSLVPELAVETVVSPLWAASSLDTKWPALSALAPSSPSATPPAT